MNENKYVSPIISPFKEKDLQLGKLKNKQQYSIYIPKHKTSKAK